MTEWVYAAQKNLTFLPIAITLKRHYGKKSQIAQMKDNFMGFKFCSRTIFIFTLGMVQKLKKLKNLKNFFLVFQAKLFFGFFKNSEKLTTFSWESYASNAPSTMKISAFVSKLWASMWEPHYNYSTFWRDFESLWPNIVTNLLKISN